MAFKRMPQTFSAKINEVTLGTGDKAVTIGGENTFPLYTFDAPAAHKVAVGFELTDSGVDTTVPGIAALVEGAANVADMAKKAEALPEVDFIALSLIGADPNGDNKSVDDCVALAKDVAAAITKPLVIMGCKNVEKDGQLFEKIAEALQGKNVLFVSTKEENYKVVSAAAGIAYNQKISAESAVDINLAKQLNVLINQMGVKPENHVMNVGSAAAGYGFEYVASTLDRVKAAALSQNDTMLQMPIITPAGDEAWGVKEAIVTEEDVPEWGAREERGIAMEISTAASCIAGGSNAVILKHPQSVKTIAQLVASLM